MLIVMNLSLSFLLGHKHKRQIYEVIENNFHGISFWVNSKFSYGHSTPIIHLFGFILYCSNALINTSVLLNLSIPNL
jgi:hypothetical protein